MKRLNEDRPLIRLSMTSFQENRCPLVQGAYYAQCTYHPPLVNPVALVRDHVLRLTYTAHDMAPFARDLGYDGEPFIWDEEERRHLRARLDALYFHLYGLSRDDAEYVLDTFPIVRREDEAAFGTYRTRDMTLAYMNALAAGDTETTVAV